MFVPESFRASGFVDSNFFHPLFLYEQVGLIVIALIIGKIRKSENPMNPAGLLEQRKPKAEETGVTAWSQKMRNNSQKSSGASLFFYYVLLYNVLRIPLEFLRIDSVFIGNFRQNALVSLFLVILAAVFLIFRNKQYGSKTS
jgi:prolipoprotein diacylglyceryltransferase